MARRQAEVGVVNHQQQVEITDEWLSLLEEAVLRAVEDQTGGESTGSVLDGLDAIEVSLLDDVTMGDVHGRFMGDPTPTDVITFDHGEILIGAETARRQAGEYGEPLARELVRYAVHGVLHLAGHDDREESARREMEREQERIVAAIWAESEAFGA